MWGPTIAVERLRAARQAGEPQARAEAGACNRPVAWEACALLGVGHRDEAAGARTSVLALESAVLDAGA